MGSVKVAFFPFFKPLAIMRFRRMGFIPRLCSLFMFRHLVVIPMAFFSSFLTASDFASSSAVFPSSFCLKGSMSFAAKSSYHILLIIE